MTEYDALATSGRLEDGESVLIQAAGSAVGLMAVQISRFLGAGKIFGTVASREQAELIAELGADVAIEHPGDDLGEIVARGTAEAGVDLVIDHVGGSVLGANLEAMALGARMISVGRLGPKVGELDLDLLALKRLRLIGVTFRTRTIEEYGDCVRRAADQLMPALANGSIRPVVDHVYPLAQALAAQERMRENRHLGKIVLDVGATVSSSG